MKNTPKPGTDAFNKLGPEARTLARWRHKTQPLNRTKHTEKAQTTLQETSQ